MMASVCINNVGMSPENFLDCPPVQPWLSPRLSFSRDFADDGGRKNGGEKPDREDSVMDFADFEFRLNDPVTMISADELFSNGKLVPLQPAAESQLEIRLPERLHSLRGEKISGPDNLYSFSPKAPGCSSVWKDLLGLKKAQNTEAEYQKATSASSKVSNAKSLKHLLRLNPRSPSIDSTPISFPLLRDSDSESVSISARASLSSSSSSGADHDDLPRLSLDSSKTTPLPTSLRRNPSRARAAKARVPAFPRPLELSAGGNIAAMRIGLSSIRWGSESELEGHAAFGSGRSLMRHSPEPDDLPPQLSFLADSPRLNASGKVIFQGLGRSSSSPSIFNGGPRSRPRGLMERSWSANVMITPVLNVPVGCLRSTPKSASVSGFGQLSLSLKEKKKSHLRLRTPSATRMPSPKQNERNRQPEIN